MDGGLGPLKRWWSKKYNLPPNHDLFESQTVAELNIEMYEDLIGRKQEIEAEIETGEVKVTGALIQQLNAIKKTLGEAVEIEDPLIDKWEREIAEGRIPDMDEKG